MAETDTAGSVSKPRRFYAGVEIGETDGSFAILLDNRPVRTPAKAPFVVPNRRLAEEIAVEWDAQGDHVAPETMPLTGLANAAIDRIGPRRATAVDNLVSHIESDPVCFRAEAPTDLVESESRHWDPLIEGFRTRFDVTLRLTHGLRPADQDSAASDAVRDYALGCNDFVLTALVDSATHLGSVVVAIAALEGDIDADSAFSAAYLEELHQAERWGIDKAAEGRRREIRRDVETALRFAALVRDQA